MTGPSTKDVDNKAAELTSMIQMLTDLHIKESAEHAAATKKQSEEMGLLIASINNLSASIKNPVNPTSPESNHGSHNNNHIPQDSHFKTPKIDFPKFNGDNPRRWVCKCERFIYLKSVAANQQTEVAAMYLEGKADSWFQDFHTGKPYISWSDFSSALCERFEDLDQEFCGDLRLLPLGGCDIVLGADCLSTLGDVTFNLAKLSISFLHQNKLITLQESASKPSIMMLSGSAMKRFLKKNTPALVGQFFHITATPTPTDIPSEVLPLLDEFKDVFAEPAQLPPQRNKLRGVVIFTILYLRSGYYQIRMHIPDIYKPAFRTHHEYYEFKVMPFGLTNAPATFQALMNSVFGPYLRKFVLVFFDDIPVYIKNLKEHIHNLSLVLALLRQHHLFAKLSKCTFAQSSLQYLGHIITAQGVAADPEKIQCMQKLPIPTTLKQLRGFLGLTGYYRNSSEAMDHLQTTN
ncbi:uncharacterized protein LOC113359009 [Papaver somniferum]|uniref:uncharacterized protein LOC113359009 n=1 Tax=Papaver somniferum TaxID=3469 RepID=UPI000E701C2D|nr:uncharacterized protein LOC113359009 [Papaver somniferum]